MKREAIIKSAEELFSKYHEIPTPVIQIAQDKGIEVIEIHPEKLDMNSESFSGALMPSESIWKIFINQDHTSTRKRFTIAHELGHYVLHLDDEHRDFIDLQASIAPYYRDSELSENNAEMEKEANIFAANLLMPEDEIVDIWNEETHIGIEELAEIFNVSEAAMSIRLQVLELIDYHEE